MEPFALPVWTRKKAVESAASVAAGSSSRGRGWAPGGPASPWECWAARSRQARPEEARGASWGAAQGGHVERARALPLHLLHAERVVLDDPRGDAGREEQPQA